MRKTAIVMGAIVLMAGGLQVVSAHEAKDLPAGPIRDRHELMEGIGKNAKAIGTSLQEGGAGDRVKIADWALKIQTSASKIAGLFPKGSTDPKSRAKPEIWTHWDKFMADAVDLQRQTEKLVEIAKTGDMKATQAQMVIVGKGSCIDCHDDFVKSGD